MSPSLAHPRPAAPLRQTCIVLRLVAVAAWAACALSYIPEWSTFTAGPPRPRTTVGGGTPALAGPLVERDETHYMLGHGGVFVTSNTVYTATFDHPSADINSRSLAWATLDPFFPHWPPWRFSWYAPGPCLGIRLWFPAALVTLVWVACELLRRRHVPAGHCRRCRYDLRATNHDSQGGVRCPECGHRSFIRPLSAGSESSA